MRPPVLKVCALFILFTCLATCSSLAQVLAFPGAEGFGAYAKGGRGGDVYHVTNTNASGAGSFSYGVTTGVPTTGRTIVFDVSGYAHISGTVRITNNKITIAGQTAPGDGFGLKDGTFLVSGDDIIIRHMRFRDGNSADAIDLDSNSANSIFDHCDAMFSNDENMSTFGSPPENLTFQWGFNAWGMETHSCGGLWDMSHTTCSHSLWAHNHTRNPKARPGMLEWINNVTFDWDIGFIMGDSESNANWTANARGCYFIGPPGNTQSKAFVKGTVATNGRPNFTLYLDNCLTDINGDGILNGTDRGYSIVEGTSYTNGQLPAPVSGDTRYYQAAAPLTGSTAGVVIDPPLLAYKKIVSNAGPLRLDYDPTRLLRDEVAELLVTNLVTQKPYHLNSPTKTNLPNGGFGNLNSSPAPVDSDQDGIPDYFETAVTKTGDVWSTTVDDHNTVVVNSGTAVSEPTFFPANTVVGTAAADKYTHLEEYLHFLATPHAIMAKSTVAVPSSIDIDLRKFTRGFANTPVFTITNILNGTAILQPDGYTLRFSPTTGNFTGLTVPYGRAKFDFTVTDADSSTWTQRFDILVSSSALPRNLTWQGDGSTNAWDSTSANWMRAGTSTIYANPDYVSFDDSGSNSPNIAITETVLPTAINIDSTKNYSFTGTGLINGATAVRKFGTGTLTIATPNTYSGGTVVDGSTLIMGTGGTTGSIGSGALTLQNGAIFTNNINANTSTSIAALTVPAGSSATFNSGSRLAVNGALTGGGSLTYNVQTTVSRFDIKGYASGFTGQVFFTGSGGVRVFLSSGFGGFDAATVDLGANIGLQPQTNSGGNTFAFGSLSSASSTSSLGPGSAGTVTYSIGALNQSTTFAGAITGAAVVNKVGTGTLTLSGISNYTGATGLNAGTLVVNGTLGTTPVSVASGATLAGSGTLGGTVSLVSGAKLVPGNLGVPATISPTALTLVAGATVPFDLSSNPASGNDKIALGGGALTTTGSPTLLFNLTDGLLGAGIYPIITGGSTSTGTLNPTFATNLPTGSRQGITLNTATRGTVNLVVTGNAATLTWLGSPTSVWDTNSTVNWTGAPEAVPNNKFLSFDAVTFDNSSTNGNVAINGVVRPRSLTINNSTTNYTFTGGSIAGGGSLTKNGSGTLTFASTVLTLSSTTTVGTTVTVDTTSLLVGMNVTGSGIPTGTTIASITNATTLVLSQAATAAATVSLNYYFTNAYSGGTFLNGGTTVLADDTANASALGTGPITFNGGTLTMFSNFSSYNSATYNFVVPTGATGTFNADARVDLYGSLSGGGILNYSIPNVRTSLFADWSAFTGVVNVTGGGNFRYGTSYGYAGFPNAAIALGNNVYMYYIGTLNGGAGTTIPIGELSGPSTAAVQGGPTGGRALTLRIGSRNTDATFAGNISEQGGIASGNATSYVKTGTGMWTLSGTAAYNGNTTVEQGTLRILGSLTSPQPIDVSPAAVLSLGGATISADSVNIHTGATFSGYGTINGDFNNDGSTSTTTGKLTITGSLTNSGTMFFANGSSLEITGDMNNSGTLSLVSGSQLTGTGSIVNNGIIDMMTGLQSLPANFTNNGIVLDFNKVVVQSTALSGNSMTVSIRGFQGHSYQLQRTASLTSATWVNVGTLQPGTGPLTGSGTLLNLVDSNSTGGSLFYRILVTP